MKLADRSLPVPELAILENSSQSRSFRRAVGFIPAERAQKEDEAMPKPARTAAKSKAGKQLAVELLQLYDDLTAVNASTAFVLHALSSALEDHALPSSRATVGGVFCVHWLNDRMQVLEKQLRNIRKRAATVRR